MTKQVLISHISHISHANHYLAILGLRAKITQLELTVAGLSSEVQECKRLSIELMKIISDLDIKGTASLAQIGTMSLEGQKRIITDRVKQ